MDRNRADDEPRRSASSGYALGRLRRAMETALSQSDPEVRHRAEQKALAWEAVLSGMASGTVEVGSRTPVAGTPAWVTLEVVQGGFATGRYIAEGPLLEDEQRLLTQVAAGQSTAEQPASERMRLNAWYLSDPGLDQLAEALRSGRYEVEVPEHGALLVVAWMVEHGHDGLALDLVAELYPLLDRLRFYPTANNRPPASGAMVRRETVGEVIAKLSTTRVPTQVAAMNETLTVWHPLYDRLVALWSETVADDWPCSTWPSDWAHQRRRWLDVYETAAASATLSEEHVRPRSNFAILRTALERCESDSSALTGRDVGRIRAALKGSIARWGEPGSSRREQLREQQSEWASRPTRQQLAGVLVSRLARLPADGGIAQLEPILDPAAPEDARTPSPIPDSLAHKVERALEAPIEELVERRVIPSSEVLARVLPQISSHVASGAFTDPELRELFARIYAAFRRRRSLLLLNLEHQVQIEELPWVRALQGFRAPSARSRDQAADTLKHTTLLALTSFPQTILPNPLVREMTALGKQAEIEIPFVEEVAADIFMGTFTTKWRAASVIASSAMQGTLYARYYGLPSPSLWAQPADSESGLLQRARLRWGKPVADDFARVCAERSKEAGAGDGSYVARNGAILEQSQILTTHNLAPLVSRLELTDRLEPRAVELAETVFGWIVRQQNTKFDNWRSQLRMVKNTAYAWRQALYLLSLVDETRQRQAVASLRASMVGRPDDWRQRFEPIAKGLEAVIDGVAFDKNGHHGPGRRFLGWSVGPHWLLPRARTAES